LRIPSAPPGKEAIPSVALPDLQPKDFRRYLELRSKRQPQSLDYDTWAAEQDFAAKPKDYVQHVETLLNSGYLVEASVSGLPKKEQAQVAKLLEKGNAANQAEIAKYAADLERVDRALNRQLIDANGWNHQLSREEAEAWVADSALGNASFWHGNSEGVVDSMLAQGLQPDRNTRGIYGRGAYLGINRGIAEEYAASAAIQSTNRVGIVETKLRVKNPLVVRSEDYNTLLANFPGQQSNGVDATNVRDFVIAKGYDSVYIQDLGYVVTFDPRQIAIVEANKFEQDSPEVQQWVAVNKSITKDNLIDRSVQGPAAEVLLTWEPDRTIYEIPEDEELYD
jgi:hypothetical protein